MASVSQFVLVVRSVFGTPWYGVVGVWYPLEVGFEAFRASKDIFDSWALALDIASTAFHLNDFPGRGGFGSVPWLPHSLPQLVGSHQFPLMEKIWRLSLLHLKCQLRF